jgi:type II secretory pathway pseudopilin PulG
MDGLLSKIRQANLNEKAQFNKTFLYVEISMVLLGIILLIIDTDQFVTASVFLIFFAIIFSMVTLFRFLMKMEKQRQIKIKNSVNYAYQAFIQGYNMAYGTDYQFHTNIDDNQDWLLTPSFSNKSIYYSLQNEDQNMRMFYGYAYNIFGEKRTKTFYFQGLYITIDGVDIEGDMQYKDRESLSGKIIQSFKGVGGQDTNDIKNYANQTPYENGQFYSQNKQTIPDQFTQLLSLIKVQSFVSRVNIGLRNNQMHIAIEEKRQRLPYVKKYQDDEMNKIKDIVYENASLLKQIEDIII